MPKAKVVNGVVKYFDDADAPITVAQAKAFAPVANVTKEKTSRNLKSKAEAALTSNATFLAINSPNASQVAAQVKALTRQNNALIRLLLGKLDSESGT